MRLAGLVMTAVVICMFVGEIIWLIPTYRMEYAAVHSEAEQRARDLIKAAVDPNVFPTVQYEKDVLTRLAPAAYIAGARIEDTAGEPLATLGEAPDLAALEARRAAVTAQADPGGQYIDVYIPSEFSGFTHAIVLRLDLEPYHAMLRARIIHAGLEALAIAAIICFGLTFALYPVLFRPISLIHRAVIKGIADQDIADQFVIKWKRTDELGTLASAINQLLIGASANYNDTLHTAHQVIENSAVATMVYKPSGELSYANPRALKLFNTGSLEELAGLDQAFLKIKAAASPSAAPITIEEALADGPYSEEGTIITPNGAVAMICMGDISYRDDGSVRRYVSQFLDAQAALSRISRLTAANEQANQRRQMAEQRSVTLKILLESCLTLLDTSNSTDGHSELVEVEPIIKNWAQIYARVGKARRVMYNRLPELNGDAKLLTALLRQALSFMDFRSEYRNSEFRLIGNVDSGMVVFDLSETLPADAEEKSAREMDNEEEWMLCLAALGKLVEHAGGTMQPPPRKGELKLSFTVPRIMHSLESDGDRTGKTKAA